MDAREVYKFYLICCAIKFFICFYLAFIHFCGNLLRILKHLGGAVIKLCKPLELTKIIINMFLQKFTNIDV